MEIGRRQLFQLAATGIPASGARDLFQAIREKLSGKEPLTWVFTGDSITHGALHTMGWRSYPEHFAERVRWELRRVRDIVINTGISGDRMPRLVGDAEWRVHRFRPHIVSLMMGMNDCVAGEAGRETYRTNLERFAGEVRERNGILLLHTPNPIVMADASKDSRRDLPAYVEILREFAAARAVPLVDHYQHWTETRKDVYHMHYLLSDGSIHPNQYGHVVFAKLLFTKLGIFDAAGSRTCRLFVP